MTPHARSCAESLATSPADPSFLHSECVTCEFEIGIGDNCTYGLEGADVGLWADGCGFGLVAEYLRLDGVFGLFDKGLDEGAALFRL